MKLLGRFITAFFLLLLFAVYFPRISLAATTPFRSANIVATDATGTVYTNLNNCSNTDGLTCDRAIASSFGNLYFKDFGNYDDFEIPQGSTITKVRIKVTGKASVSAFGLFVSLGSNCQNPSDLWTLWQLNGGTINTHNFVTNLTESGFPNAVKASCLSPISFENKSFIFRVNYSSGQPWSANIDNFEVAFDYELPPTPPPSSDKTPLIIIPGIGGSELKTPEMRIWVESDGHGDFFTHTYGANEKVWVNNFQAGLPGEDDYFDILRMKEDGQTSEANLELTGDLFGGYGGTINFFVSNGYTLNQDLFVFPYDWRKDISLTAPLLDQKIEDIKTQTGKEKVDILAHSMGGLVARNYISDSLKAQNVRKLFTLGTPHLGSVKFLSAILYGLCLKFEIGSTCLSINPSELKDVIQNMVTGYELAPTQKYFEYYSGEDDDHPYPFADLIDVDEDGLTGILNYSQIKNLLANLNHNTGLFGPSEIFHALDDNLSNTNGLEVTNIVGSGWPTLGQIIESYSVDFFGNKIPHKDLININGDKTVPLFSASLNDFDKGKSLLGDAKIFYTNQEHGELVIQGPALDLVKNILEDNSELPDGVLTQPYNFNGVRVSVHSPVNIHVYDENGNHTGPTTDGDFEENIPGSAYDTLGDSKFVWLPSDGLFTIKFEATDQGSFDFKIKTFENNTNTKSVLYKNIPLTESTKAEAVLDTVSAEPPIIEVDMDGNGTFDKEINLANILIGDENSDITPPQTNVDLFGTQGNNNWFISDVLVTLSSEDNVNGSGVDKIEYSLDDGQTVNTYIEPFIISSEDINKLRFRSIDNAGNEEVPQETEIKIDKTKPEAKIYVDQNIQDLVVEGLDLNPTIVEKLENQSTNKKEDAIYKITDEAGNNLTMDVRDVEKAKRDRFRIYSIQYNDEPLKILENNHFNVNYNGEKERASIREQNFEIKGDIKIKIQYDNKKDESKIIVKELNQEKVKEIREGLTILNLVTKEGNLATTY